MFESRGWLRPALATMMLCLVSAAASAQTATLAWDASAGASGYVIRWGQALGSYPQSANAGGSTSSTITGLSPGATYWAIAEAYDASGRRSGPSQPLQFVAPSKRVADFNGDGLNDLLWQNLSTGELAVWRMNGINQVSGGYLSPANVGDTNWKIMGTLDVNRDGQADLLFQHETGYVATWLMSGGSRIDGGGLMLTRSVESDPQWRIVGTGDMDRDGFSDIIWQHADGRVAAWYMSGDGLQVRETVDIASVDASWRVAGIEDFNRDGKRDLLWRHSLTGQVVIWWMDGRQYLGNMVANAPVVGDMLWQIVATGDFSGDGKPDLIWRNSSTGDLRAWFMDGATYLSGWSLNPGRVDTNWHIVGPR